MRCNAMRNDAMLAPRQQGICGRGLPICRDAPTVPADLVLDELVQPPGPAWCEVPDRLAWPACSTVALAADPALASATTWVCFSQCQEQSSLLLEQSCKCWPAPSGAGASASARACASETPFVGAQRPQRLVCVLLGYSIHGDCIPRAFIGHPARRPMIMLPLEAEARKGAFRLLASIPYLAQMTPHRSTLDGHRRGCQNGGVAATPAL